MPAKLFTDSRTDSQSVDRVLHITRVTRFGEEGETEPGLIAAPTTLVTQAPRPQPKNLKARYQPFGVANGSAGPIGVDAWDDEDVEMTQAPPLNAKSTTPKKAAKKRKHGDVEKGSATPQDTVSTPVKKPKKARVESSNIEQADPSPAKAAKVTASEPSSVKKPKGKDKSKKKAAAGEPSEFKKPAKVTPILPPAIPGVKSP